MKMRRFLACLAACLCLGSTSARAAVVNATYTTGNEVPVTASSYTATGNTVNFTLNFAPPAGKQLMVVKNTGNGFINGTFGNLAQGQTVLLSFGGATYSFVANYYGGTGNDLVLVWKSNRLYGWGNNGLSQLGNNSDVDSLVPVAVTNTGVLAGKTVLSVAAGQFHGLALCSDGTLASWGSNLYGQLGDNTTNDSMVPVAVVRTGVLSGKTVVAVAAGQYFSLALCSDGTVATWGRGNEGQLGNNGTANSSVPVALSTAGLLSGKLVAAAAAGTAHGVALCTDGTVVAWGRAAQGQLGNNGTTQSNVPVTVVSSGALSGKTVTAVTAGEAHSVVLCSDGTLASWGFNLNGQLGNNSNTQSNVPVTVTSTGVLSGKTVVALATASFHSVVLCSDGFLAAWGFNSSGQLGNNTQTNSSVPVAVTSSGVLSGKTVVAVTTGGAHSVAFCSDSSVATWGSNSSGQLGNNSTTLSKVPVAVSTAPLLSGERFAGLHVGSLGSYCLALVGPPLSNNANLTGLTPGSGTLSPGFTPAGTSYAVSVPISTATFSLTPTVAQEGATVKVNNVAVASGAASQSILLNGGANVITTVVTAPDGVTTKTYTVTVTRAATLTATFNAASDVPATASAWSSTGCTVNLSLNFAPAVGTQLTVVRNTGLAFLSGAFGNLAHGQAVTLSYNGVVYQFVANYFGGTGNDLVLVWKFNRPYAWGFNEIGQLGSVTPGDVRLPLAVTSNSVLAGKTILALTAGANHSLALCSDGTLAAWGGNGSGELGDNSTNDSPVPVAVIRTGVLAGKTVVALAAGGGHSLALCSDGTVAAWGDNFYGQLGNNSTTSSSVPVAVTTSGALAGKTVVGVAAGSVHSLARCSDGTVVAWGYNATGGLGNNSTTHSSVPVAVTSSGVLSGKTVVSVAAGDAHSVAVCADGTVATWGLNSFGQLGNNSLTNSLVPVAVTSSGVLAGKTVASAAAGQVHTLALCTDGTLASWGRNAEGQLGNNSQTSSSVPMAVASNGVLAGKTVLAVAAGVFHSLAHCSDGTLATWGSNEFGQLGIDNSIGGSAVPVAVVGYSIPPGARFTGLSSSRSGDFSLALVASPASAALSALSLSAGPFLPVFDPAVAYYSIGVPNTTSSLTLTATAAEAGASILINNVPVGSGLASGPISLNGGNNVITILVTAADGVTTGTYTVSVDRDVVLEVTFHSADEVGLTIDDYNAAGCEVDLDLGFAPAPGTQLLVIRNTGTRFLGGMFLNLEQGDELPLSYNNQTYYFVANYFGGTGNDLVLVWRGTSPYAWGSNDSDELGNGLPGDTALPGPVLNTGVLAGKTVLALAAGGAHSLALCSDGTLASWGNNSSGQLGDGSTTESHVPVAVQNTGALSDKIVAGLSAGATHSLALCSDGTVAAWGLNDYGQLGTGSLSNSFSPVAVTSSGVLAGKTVVAVAAGAKHSLAVCSDGTVAAWGYNGFGQLGNNSTTDSTVPVAVNRSGILAGKTVVAVAGGDYHSLALCSDGTLATWGGSPEGQLGNNSTATSTVPVAVTTTGALAGKTVTAIAAGQGHCLALCSDGTIVAWGSNNNGQLGNNSFLNSPVPVAVVTSGALAGRTVRAIAAGASHSVALCSDGTAVAWGAGNFGQLGNDSTNGSPVPAAVENVTLAPGQRFTGLFSGSAGSFTVALVPATPSVASTNPLLITSTTAQLGGNVLADGGQTFLERGVVYAPTSVNEEPTLGAPGVQSIVSSGSVGGFSVLVSNLAPGTSYSFAAYATNLVGTSYSPIGTFTTLTAVEYWRQTWYGSSANSGNGADSADPYRTGVPNLLAFAFFGPAQDPARTLVSQLPRPVLVGGNLTYTFIQPGGVTGVTYGAQWCTSLSAGNWQPMTDTGTGGQHIFSVPITGQAKVFVRLVATGP